jgi:hypothetical protein
MKLLYQCIKTPASEISRKFISELVDSFSIETFVETGTYRGDTIALLADKFKRLVSIELSEEYHKRARERFAHEPRIELLQGDSARRLSTTLNSASGPTLIWLDAHFSGGDTAKGAGNTPVLEEAKAICAADRRDLIIFVDDLRLFGAHPEASLVHDSHGGYPSVTALIEALDPASARDHYVFNDALLSIPKHFRDRYEPSSVLLACTQSRIGPVNTVRALELEDIIASAKGSERQEILGLSEAMEVQIEYRLAGHYAYWRGIVRENDGQAESARRDFEAARRAGVEVPARPGRSRFSTDVV